MAGPNLEAQEAEITLLKEDFPGNCKVISSVGDFLHVVSIQKTGQNVVFKFQLNDSYPDSPPNIIIRSPSLQQHSVSELTDFLYQIADNQRGHGMLKVLVSAAEGWLQNQNINVAETRNLDREPSKMEDGKMSKKGKRMGKLKKLHEKVAKEGQEEKLPSMKTAGDVINRIQWDDNVPSDEVLVGYMDRFKGVIEKYFIAFSWEDISTVDYNVLAIPQHRIQYFKYKDIKIWDKNDRLDCVFGSTGSKITITDIISRYQNYNSEKEERHVVTDDTCEDHCDNDDDDDSDSDDDINVIIGVGSSLNRPLTESDIDLIEQTDDYWQDKLRPNFFLSVRVLDEKIVKGVEDVQDFILEQEPRYSNCCIPPRALHITLCTLGLDTVEQKAHAVQAVQKMKKEIVGIIPKDAQLHVAGVDNFYSRVMFAKVLYPPQFMEFVDHIKLCLTEEGIDIRDNHDFVPHMTIMKVSRLVSREMGTKDINPFLYSGFSEMEFGSQPVNNLHLCEMVDARQDDGFYLTATSLEF